MAKSCDIYRILECADDPEQVLAERFPDADRYLSLLNLPSMQDKFVDHCIATYPIWELIDRLEYDDEFTHRAELDMKTHCLTLDRYRSCISSALCEKVGELQKRLGEDVHYSMAGLPD